MKPRAPALRLAGAVVILTGANTFPAGAPAEDPARLDPRIQPVSQSLRLFLDPAKDTYEGVARVEVQFQVSTNRFRFHASQLDLRKATLDGDALSIEPGEAGIAMASTRAPVAPGLHVLEIAFHNDFQRDGTALYKAEADSRPGLYTQFEPVDARRAFPCWDEPGFKIPWRLTLAIPRDLEAVGNMPVAQSSDSDGLRVLEFGRTPPMPSYLVAFAVGAFESIPVEGGSVPGRIVTVAGKTPMARLAAREVPALLDGLERYFGVPYPYPKLDHLAVPEFLFGAMENVGAITYRDSLLLLDPADVGRAQRRGLLEILAHEMAHMWFGNLVTMEWWDDTWLNESFATWASYKIAEQVHPTLGFDLAGFDSAAAARANDSQPSVKAIRRPFRGDDNLQEAFDTLSYQKGQAILRMIEGWIGPEAFQLALKRYFRRHQWGNARADDLWEAFAETGDTGLRETLRRYLEQPGIPELGFTRLPGDRLEVRQRRYRTLTAQGISEQLWQVPIVVRYGDSSGSKTARLLLKGPSQVFDVPGLDQARWIHPNAGESGHYLWNLPPELTAVLGQDPAVPLSSIERLGLLRAADFALKSGNLPAVEALRLALTHADDPEPEVRSTVAGTVLAFRDWIGPGDRPRYAPFIRKTLRPMLNRVGLEPKPDETAETEQLRGMLLAGLGIPAGDPEVIAFCRQAALRQFDQPRSVPAALAPFTLYVAAWHADATWAAQARAAFEHATDPDLRARFLAMLTAHRDPALVRAGLDYGLTRAVRPTELPGLLMGPSETAGVRFDWLAANYGAVKGKLPAETLPFLVHVLGGADSDLLAKGRAFFLDPARRDPLTELKLTEVADAIDLETALRARHGEALLKYATESPGGPSGN